MFEQKTLPAFVCRRCGDCCRGQGGIMVTPVDIVRLSLHLDMSSEKFITTFLEEINGRRRVRSVNGCCVFFAEGCSVHPAKPTVCRVWPFFQGNMVDELSWRMAQEACPGIEPEAGHAAFVRQGLEYLQSVYMEHADDGPIALDLGRLKSQSD